MFIKEVYFLKFWMSCPQGPVTSFNKFSFCQGSKPCCVRQLSITVANTWGGYAFKKKRVGAGAGGEEERNEAFFCLFVCLLRLSLRVLSSAWADWAPWSLCLPLHPGGPEKQRRLLTSWEPGSRQKGEDWSHSPSITASSHLLKAEQPPSSIKAPGV